MTTPNVLVNRALLRRAARILDREAQQLAESYCVPGSRVFECLDAKRDHDQYRTTAKNLRTAAGAP